MDQMRTRRPEPFEVLLADLYIGYRFTICSVYVLPTDLMADWSQPDPDWFACLMVRLLNWWILSSADTISHLVVR